MEIPEIKRRLTLAMVLQYYGLKPDRNRRLQCPFHADKTPSLQVYYKTQTVYCFSSNCKTHGKAIDVIDFIMYKENSTKHEAIVKAREILHYYEGKIQHQQKPIEVTSEAAQLTIPREQFLQNMFLYFKNGLVSSKPARDYLQKRCINPQIIEAGYNTAQFHHGARRDETLINNCVATGLLIPWGNNTRKPEEQAYKAFGKECIVFALRNKANAITGLYFRSITNNDNQKHYYLKASSGLYPCYPGEATTKLIITESIIDAASLQQIEAITKEYTILAAYGTNRLNEEMKVAIQALPQLQEIIFGFDSDEAGNKAAVKYKDELQALLPHLTITKLNLPNKDVNETLQAHDEHVFEQLLKERLPVPEGAGTTEFSFSEEKEKVQPESQPPIEQEEQAAATKACPLGRLEGLHPHKLRYTSETAVYYVQGSLPRTNEHLKIMLVIESRSNNLKARNKIDLYEDKQVEKLCKEVSEKLYLRKDLLEGDLYKLTDLLEQYIEKQMQLSKNETNGVAQHLLTVQERTVLESFAKQPQLINRLNALLGQSGIVGEQRNRILLLIVAASHILNDTLHALIQGSSGSGKTRLLKQIADCMPREVVRKYTRLSDKVLYNFPENFFSHTVLFLEDVDGLSEEAEFAHRELQSNGELSSASSIKLDNGQITAGEKIVKGPIASIVCTTKGEVYEDNMSRVFLIAVDESPEKINQVIEYQNKKAGGIIDEKQEKETKGFIQNFIRILKPYPVINPYYNRIYLPADAHKILRLNEMLQTMIKTITLLNQYQRKKDTKGKLISEIEDIETAIHIIFECIVLKVDELDGSLRQFYERLKKFVDKKGRNYEFTRFEVMEATGVKKTQQHVYMNKLVAFEYIQQKGFANRGFSYKIVHWDNYTALRERIKSHLTTQVEAIKAEHQRTPERTPELATVND